MTYYLLTGEIAEQARTMLGRPTRRLAELLFEGSPPHRHVKSYAPVLDSEAGVVVAASPGAPKPTVQLVERISQRRYLDLAEVVDAELWKRFWARADAKMMAGA